MFPKFEADYDAIIAASEARVANLLEGRTDVPDHSAELAAFELLICGGGEEKSDETEEAPQPETCEISQEETESTQPPSGEIPFILEEVTAALLEVEAFEEDRPHSPPRGAYSKSPRSSRRRARRGPYSPKHSFKSESFTSTSVYGQTSTTILPTPEHISPAEFEARRTIYHEEDGDNSPSQSETDRSHSTESKTVYYPPQDCPATFPMTPVPEASSEETTTVKPDPTVDPQALAVAESVALLRILEHMRQTNSAPTTLTDGQVSGPCPRCYELSEFTQAIHGGGSVPVPTLETVPDGATCAMCIESLEDFRETLVTVWHPVHGDEPHDHPCSKCRLPFEHDHSSKPFAQARCYLQTCEPCLDQFCYAKVMQGYLHSTPLRVMGPADIQSHAEANSVTIMLRSTKHEIRFGFGSAVICVHVSDKFDHAIGIVSARQPQLPRWPGEIALSKPHTAYEIIAAVHNLPKKTTQSFYNADDRARTQEISDRHTQKPKQVIIRPPPKVKIVRAPRPVLDRPATIAPRPPRRQRGRKNGPAPPEQTVLPTLANASSFDNPVAGRTYPIPMPSNSRSVFPREEEQSRSVFSSSSFEPLIHEDYQAARWSADNFALMPFERQVDSARGIVPYTMGDVAKSIANFLENGGHLPRRFQGTVSKRVIADALVTLEASNYTEGDTIYIWTPNLGASRGAVVLTRGPGENTLTPANMLAVVIPQIDTEELGALQNVNGSILSVGIQQSTGADSAVSAFSNMFQGCVTTVFPFSTIPGKAAYATTDKRSLSQMVTDQTMMIGNFNYGVPDHLVRTGGSFDAQSSNVIIAANLVSPPASAKLETGDSFVIAAVYDGSNGGAPGPTSQVGFDWISNELFPSELKLVWRLSRHASYLRHALYGNLHVQAHIGRINVNNDANSRNSVEVLTRIDYIDGSAIEHTEAYGAVRDPTSVSNTTLIEGSGAAALNEGKLITDISVWVRAKDTNINNVDWALYIGSFVRVKFDEINAATEYSMIAITGARHGQTLQIGLAADTEVLLDPTGNVARYLSPSETIPIDPRHVAHMFNAMKQDGAHLYLLTSKGGDGAKIDYHAGEFGGKLKKFFQNVFRALAPMAGAAGTAVGTVLGGPAGGMLGGAIGDYVSSRARSADYSPIRQDAGTLLSIASADSGLDHSASFGDGQRNSSASLLSICDGDVGYDSAAFSAGNNLRLTGFQFPVISTATDSAKIINVVKGVATTPAPEFVKVLRSNLSGDGEYSGASCGLAFLLAALQSRGAPTIAGIYSGEIKDMTVSKNSASFTLLPVDLTEEKLATFGPATALVMTPNGPCERGLPVEIDETGVFAGFKQVRCSQMPAPEGYPGHACRISLLW